MQSGIVAKRLDLYLAAGRMVEGLDRVPKNPDLASRIYDVIGHDVLAMFGDQDLYGVPCLSRQDENAIIHAIRRVKAEEQRDRLAH